MVGDSDVCRLTAGLEPVAVTLNRGGRSPFVFVCDHASNYIPDTFSHLGLGACDRLRHIAWDPGALGVSKVLSRKLDAPLIYANFSRLIIDPNRMVDAADLIPSQSEGTSIPGNDAVDANERLRRIGAFHAPYHNAIADVLDRRTAAGQQSILIAMHSFTPVYLGVARPWQAGLIAGEDEAYPRVLFATLQADDPDLVLGWNQPYAARQGVYYTAEIHAEGRGLASAMIEIRHDEILQPPGVRQWADRLARCLTGALEAWQAEAALANRTPSLESRRPQ